ncbi:hypothetical protein ACYSNR_00820 [Enterococcus sp. LJL128]
MELNTLEDIQTWMKNNLVNKEQGREITGQSKQAFSQSVRLGYINPFFEIEGSTSTNVKLFLKSDLEDYRDKKRRIN